MSRSLKKPYFTDNGLHRKQAKRTANKKVRVNWNIKSGKAYKKLFKSWIICDYSFHCPKIQKLTENKISKKEK